MQNAFQLQSPVVQRGGRPLALVAQGSMVDHNLGNHQFSMSQMSQAFAENQNPSSNGMAVANSQNTDADVSERILPSTEVTNETIDDAYVQFILYCNPSLPDHVDTSDLKKGFRSPPKSDGKNFDPFVLFELISRLEAKEIKTWAELVVELGVEPPDASKGQSTQKVQQFAVRLKVITHSSTSIFIITCRCHGTIGHTNCFIAMASSIPR